MASPNTIANRSVASTTIAFGYLPSNLNPIYTCPNGKNVEILAIRLVNTEPIAHGIQCETNINGKQYPFIPSSFILEPECTAELVDENQQIGVKAGDLIQMAADKNSAIFCWVTIREFSI